MSVFIAGPYGSLAVLLNALSSLSIDKGFWGTGEQGLLFQGNRGTKAKYWGTGNIENQIFDIWGTGEQANLFQGNKGTGTPPPPPGRASIEVAR